MEKNKKEKIRLISWNINGIRAAHRKGLLGFIKHAGADFYCFQEIKAHREQIPSELLYIEGYNNYLASPERKGYSGVCIYSRLAPDRVILDTGVKRFDDEGRMIGLDFKDTVLFNVYFPNGGRSCKRLDYKMDFYRHFLGMINDLRDAGKNIIFCGDVNTAHKEIDLARPEANKNNTGFLPQERAWIDRVIRSGYVDTFREFDKGPENYTWWDYKTRARERNVGWRLDYFFVSESVRKSLIDSSIMKGITGSDHCPVVLELNGGMFS